MIIHGFGGSAKEIQYLCDFLQKRGVDARTVLLAGHGGTKCDLSASSHTDWIESAQKAVAALAPQKVDLIGFSMGGLICAQLAGIPHVDKLVFVNTPIYFWNIKAIAIDIIGGLIKRQFERITYYTKSISRVSTKSSIDFLHILFASKPMFAQVYKPSLILQCKDDESVWPSSARYIKRKIGESALLRFYSGGGHQLFSDRAAGIRDSACEDIHQFLYSKINERVNAMNFDKLVIKPMTKEYARQISRWKYDGVYSFYDHDEDSITECMNGTYYACTGEDGELIGYFCYGKAAQIPTVEKNVYDDEYLDIGLGLRPDVCGKGLGYSFMNKGLDYAQQVFGTKHFRLSVAVFNERAIKLYKKVGFCTECEVTNSYSMKKFIIMTCATFL